MRIKRINHTAPDGRYGSTIIDMIDTPGDTVTIEGRKRIQDTSTARFELEGINTVLQRKYIAVLSEGSALTELVTAALGEVPEELETADLIGKRVIIEVNNVTRDGRTYSNVVAAYPVDELREEPGEAGEVNETEIEAETPTQTETQTEPEIQTSTTVARRRPKPKKRPERPAAGDLAAN